MIERIIFFSSSDFAGRKKFEAATAFPVCADRLATMIKRKALGKIDGNTHGKGPDGGQLAIESQKTEKVNEPPRAGIEPQQAAFAAAAWAIARTRSAHLAAVSQLEAARAETESERSAHAATKATHRATAENLREELEVARHGLTMQLTKARVEAKFEQTRAEAAQTALAKTAKALTEAPQVARDGAIEAAQKVFGASSDAMQSAHTAALAKSHAKHAEAEARVALLEATVAKLQASSARSPKPHRRGGMLAVAVVVALAAFIVGCACLGLVAPDGLALGVPTLPRMAPPLPPLLSSVSPSLPPMPLAPGSAIYPTLPPPNHSTTASTASATQLPLPATNPLASLKPPSQRSDTVRARVGAPRQVGATAFRRLPSPHEDAFALFLML